MDAADWAQALRETALLLELKGENPFKARAYENAARAVQQLGGEEVRRLAREGRLASVPGLGRTLVSPGRRIGRKRPLRLPGRAAPGGPLGGRRADPRPRPGAEEGPAAACRAGGGRPGGAGVRLPGKPAGRPAGFRTEGQEKVLAGVRFLLRSRGRHLYPALETPAAAALAFLQALPGVRRAALVGSLRRGCGVAANIDLLVETETPETHGRALGEHLAGQARGGPVTSPGRFVFFRDPPGTEVRLQAVPPGFFGAALLFFTGSREHLEELARRAPGGWLSRALAGGWEAAAGLAPGDLPQSEDEAYGALGLPFIPPELREGAGEVERAGEGRLGPLLEPGDLRGTFHVHTTYSDGTAPVAAMAAAAAARGWGFLGIADHSRSAAYAGGLSAERLRAQRREIDDWNRGHPELFLFAGVESDILADGGLDYEDEVLAGLDFVIGSVHSHFGLDEERMTARLLRAMENPRLTMLGHPSGRLLLSREPYRADMLRVVEAAARLGVVLELNANPHRLDLDWRWCRVAADKGIPVAVNPDAHRPEGLDDVRYGVLAARKGWLGPRHVLNCAGREEIGERLAARRP